MAQASMRSSFLFVAVLVLVAPLVGCSSTPPIDESKDNYGAPLKPRANIGGAKKTPGKSGGPSTDL